MAEKAAAAAGKKKKVLKKKAAGEKPAKGASEEKKAKGKAGKAGKAGSKVKVKAKSAAEEEEKPQRKTKATRLAEAQAKAEAMEKEAKADGEGGAEVDEDEPRGVLYIAHLPDGFMEPQLRQYFSQFGKVLRIRLSRSKKSTRCKGYGWVEFAEESVAKIAQETMDKYLMWGRQLVVKLVPKDEQHPALFKGCRRKMKNLTMHRKRQFRETYNNRPGVEVDGQVVPRQTLTQQKTRRKAAGKLKRLLKTFEIDYDLDEVSGASLLAAPSSPRANLAKTTGGGATSPKTRPKASPKLAAKESPKAAATPAPAATEAKKRPRGELKPIAKKKARKA